MKGKLDGGGGASGQRRTQWRDLLGHHRCRGALGAAAVRAGVQNAHGPASWRSRSSGPARGVAGRLRHSAQCRVGSFWVSWSERVRAFSSCSPAEIRRSWSGGMPSLSWTLASTFSVVSVGSTSRAMVVPVGVFTRICLSVHKAATTTEPLCCLVVEKEGGRAIYCEVLSTSFS